MLTFCLLIFSTDVEETSSLLSCDTTYLPLSELSASPLRPFNLESPSQPSSLNNVPVAKQYGSSALAYQRDSVSNRERERQRYVPTSRSTQNVAFTSELDSSDTDSQSQLSDGNSTANDLQLLKTVIANLKAKRKRERAQRVSGGRVEVVSSTSSLSPSPQGAYMPEKYACPTRRSLRHSANTRTIPPSGRSPSERSQHSSPENTEKGQMEVSTQCECSQNN